MLDAREGQRRRLAEVVLQLHALEFTSLKAELQLLEAAVRRLWNRLDPVEALARAGLGQREVLLQRIAADEQRRSSIAAFENLRAEQKTIGKDVARAKGDEKVALIARTKTLSAQVKAAEAAYRLFREGRAAGRRRAPPRRPAR